MEPRRGQSALGCLVRSRKCGEIYELHGGWWVYWVQCPSGGEWLGLYSVYGVLYGVLGTLLVLYKTAAYEYLSSVLSKGLLFACWRRRVISLVLLTC